jgi:hypothetical protein
VRIMVVEDPSGRSQPHQRDALGSFLFKGAQSDVMVISLRTLSDRGRRSRNEHFDRLTVSLYALTFLYASHPSAASWAQIPWIVAQSGTGGRPSPIPIPGQSQQVE